MLRALVVPLIPLLLGAQVLPPPDPKLQLRNIQIALENKQIVEAHDEAVRLDATLQALLQARSAGDVNQRVDDVLRWVPETTESLLVVQQPFGGATAGLLPASLSGLSGVLRGHRARLAVALASGASSAAFLFLDGALEPAAFGASGEGILGRPVWRVNGFTTLARPDLLISASSRELLTGIVLNVLKGSATRALPASLPEWGEVDRTAPVWGLRHSGGVAGIAMKFDPARQTLEVRYLSSAGRLAAGLDRDFQVDRLRPGLWTLKANVRERGNSPWDAALALLGMGSAR